MQRSQLLAAAAILGLTVAGPVITSASAQIYSGNNRRTNLEGDRFETMRSLAHFLDEGTQFTLEEATDALANSRNRNDRALVSALQRLADRTSAFHDRLDSYEANPWDVDTDVRSLLTEARRVNSRMRRINAVSNLYDDCAAVVADVNRMQRLLAGEDVQVPSAHAEWDNRDNVELSCWATCVTSSAGLLRLTTGRTPIASTGETSAEQPGRRRGAQRRQQRHLEQGPQAHSQARNHDHARRVRPASRGEGEPFDGNRGRQRE